MKGIIRQLLRLTFLCFLNFPITGTAESLNVSDASKTKEKANTHARTQKSPVTREGVSTTARCAEGELISGRVKKSNSKVEIIKEFAVGCDEEGQRCMGWQVDAIPTDEKGFDIEVTVTCTEDGLDTEFDRALEQDKEQKLKDKGE